MILRNVSNPLLNASRLDAITASSHEEFCRLITCWKIVLTVYMLDDR